MAQDQAWAAPPGSQLERLLALAKAPAPVRTAVVHPVDGLSLAGAVEAAEARLIEPVLVRIPEPRWL